MFIERIRLSEVGRFIQPVEIGPLSRGLNVLAGPNEMGKSTVFQALRMLFTENYTARKESVRNLRPYAGGAPHVACDFYLGETAWTLSKTFLAAKSAELRDRDGRRVYRGADVEPALQDILSEAGVTAGALGIHWVGQGDSFAQPVAEAGVRATIGDLVAAEAQAVTGGSELVTVLAIVMEEIEQVLTRKGRQPKTGGRLHEAIVRRQELETAYAKASDRHGVSEERRERLEHIKSELATLEDAAADEALKERLGVGERRREEGEKALAQVALLDERLARLKETDAAERGQLARFDGAIATFDTLTGQLGELAGRLAELGGKRDEARAALRAAQSVHADLTAARERLQRAKLRAERKARHDDVVAQVEALRQRLARADAIYEQAAAVAKSQAEVSVSGDCVKRLQQLSRRLGEVDAQILASAPRVGVAYLPEARAKVELDGRELGDQEVVVVDEVRVLTIAGVGTIRIEPGGRENGRAPLELRDGLRSELRAALAKAGCESVADAEAALTASQELAARQQSYKAALEGLAPAGLTALRTELATAENQQSTLSEGLDQDFDQGLDRDGNADDCTGYDAREWERNQAALLEAETELGTAQARVAAVDGEYGRGETERALIQSRLDGLADAVPATAGAREQARAILVGKAQEAAAALNTAIRELEAWKEVAPDRAAMGELIASIDGLKREVQNRLERRARLRESMKALEGAFERDLEDGVGGDLESLAEMLEGARRREAQIRRDVEALLVLEGELGRADAERRVAVTEPMARRIRGLAGEVIPDAAFTVGQDFNVTGVRRDGTEEMLDVLSNGTREQIAVLARLALADALAEGGVVLPVVLDDALVFSDDERLGAMFSVLEQSARNKQIIVLTCHGRSFASLVSEHGATELRLA